VTITFEFIGAIILTLHFRSAVGLTPFQAFYHGVFHSISAFCNAGFSLYSDNLLGYQRDATVIVVMGLLIVIGGLGFVVIYNLINFRFWLINRQLKGKLSLQTKTVLISSGLLIAFFMAFFLLLEWGGAMTRLSPVYKFCNAFFHAVTPRTAGFNTLPVTSLSNAVLFVTLVMMFVGASPGSTGGGIKTCTLAVLLATSRAIVRGKKEVTLFRRTVSYKVVQEAICVAIFALVVIAVVCTCLLVTERNLSYLPEKGLLLKLLFEVFSAFGTVGLSMGITPSLSVLGKLLIVMTMFIGRLGPLTLALIISRKEAEAVLHYPDEDMMIG
jgi:trk system potassium uptake protein TrkH